MKLEYDDIAQMNVVVLEGSESCEAVVDACVEGGAVAAGTGELYVRFPGQENELITRQELRKRVLERRPF